MMLELRWGLPSVIFLLGLKACFVNASFLDSGVITIGGAVVYYSDSNCRDPISPPICSGGICSPHETPGGTIFTSIFTEEGGRIFAASARGQDECINYVANDTLPVVSGKCMPGDGGYYFTVFGDIPCSDNEESEISSKFFFASTSGGNAKEEINKLGTEKDCPPQMCCMAMTAQCLACAKCMTVEDYCIQNPRTPGCDANSGGGQPVKFCPSSPPQYCRMLCPFPTCPQPQQCAMRKGGCCEYECIEPPEPATTLPPSTKPAPINCPQQVKVTYGNKAEYFLDASCSKPAMDGPVVFNGFCNEATEIFGNVVYAAAVCLNDGSGSLAGWASDNAFNCFKAPATGVGITTGSAGECLKVDNFFTDKGVQIYVSVDSPVFYPYKFRDVKIHPINLKVKGSCDVKGC